MLRQQLTRHQNITFCKTINIKVISIINQSLKTMKIVTYVTYISMVEHAAALEWGPFKTLKSLIKLLLGIILSYIVIFQTFF